MSNISIFNGAIPGTPVGPDGSANELGLQFHSDVNGYVLGVQFYKGSSSNGGTHIGNLWTTGGTKLASVTFTGETVSGWQYMPFASPFAITASTVYVVSYFAPQGRYSYDATFTYPVNNSPLHTESSNAFYNGSGSDVFPGTGPSNANYYVDVLFTGSTAILASEIEYRYSGGGANGNPALSLGGAIGGLIATGADGNVLPDVTAAQAAAGETNYACIYIKNNTIGGNTWTGVVVWIDGVPIDGSLAIGLDSAAIGATAASTAANVNAAPSPTITFTSPTTKGAGLAVGDIPPGSYKALWLKRTIPASSTQANDGVSIRCEGNTPA